MTQKAIHNHNVINIKVGDTKKKKRSHRRKRIHKHASLVQHVYNPVSPLTTIQQQLPTNKPYYIETKSINPQIQDKPIPQIEDKPASTSHHSFAPARSESTSHHDFIPPRTPSIYQDLARNTHVDHDNDENLSSISFLSGIPTSHSDSSSSVGHRIFPTSFLEQYHSPHHGREEHDNSFGPFTSMHDDAMDELNQVHSPGFHDHVEDVQTRGIRQAPHPRGATIAEYEHQLRLQNRRTRYHEHPETVAKKEKKKEKAETKLMEKEDKKSKKNRRTNL